MDIKIYTEEEVIAFCESLGKFYKYNEVNKTWNMQTELAPGMLHETTKQLLDRHINTPKWWESRKKELGI